MSQASLRRSMMFVPQGAYRRWSEATESAVEEFGGGTVGAGPTGPAEKVLNCLAAR